jgi:hypothetical protein
MSRKLRAKLRRIACERAIADGPQPIEHDASERGQSGARLREGCCLTRIDALRWRRRRLGGEIVVFRERGVMEFGDPRAVRFVLAAEGVPGPVEDCRCVGGRVGGVQQLLQRAPQPHHALLELRSVHREARRLRKESLTESGSILFRYALATAIRQTAASTLW